MSAHSRGYFEAYVNRQAMRPSSEDRALMESIRTVCRGHLGACQLRWAGSQHKGTAVAGSDLDLCLESTEPITEAQRRLLRAALEGALGRPATILSHAIRLPQHGQAPRLDLAFAHAAFGSRPLPDAEPFKARPPRQMAARALKVWARSQPGPVLPGWVVEALVVHLDGVTEPLHGLELFQRIITWLVERATPAAVEGVLRPQAAPRWNPAWSARLPGRLEALRNQARALQRRLPEPSTWRSADDAGRWLSGVAPSPG